MPQGLAVRSRFFQFASWYMLAAVVFAFGPTFFFDRHAKPPLPGHLMLHGAVLTAWFALPVLQTALVARKRVDLHRTVGRAGIAWATAVVAVSLYTSLAAVPRLKLAQPRQTDEAITQLIVGGLVNVVIFFPFLFARALANVPRPEAHKRWIYFTYALFYGPPLSRVIQVWQMPLLAILFTPALAVVAIVVHDWRQMRKLHPATVRAGSTLLAAIAIGRLLAGTSAARAAMVWMGL